MCIWGWWRRWKKMGIWSIFWVSSIYHAHMTNLTQGKAISGLTFGSFFCHSEGPSKVLFLFVACDAWLTICTEWLTSSRACEARTCSAMGLLSWYDNLQKCLEEASDVGAIDHCWNLTTTLRQYTLRNSIRLFILGVCFEAWTWGNKSSLLCFLLPWITVDSPRTSLRSLSRVSFSYISCFIYILQLVKLLAYSWYLCLLLGWLCHFWIYMLKSKMSATIYGWPHSL